MGNLGHLWVTLGVEVLSRGKGHIGPAFARLGPPNPSLDIYSYYVENFCPVYQRLKKVSAPSELNFTIFFTNTLFRFFVSMAIRLSHLAFDILSNKSMKMFCISLKLEKVYFVCFFLKTSYETLLFVFI